MEPTREHHKPATSLRTWDYRTYPNQSGSTLPHLPSSGLPSPGYVSEYVCSKCQFGGLLGPGHWAFMADVKSGWWP